MVEPGILIGALQKSEYHAFDFKIMFKSWALGGEHGNPCPPDVPLTGM